MRMLRALSFAAALTLVGCVSRLDGGVIGEAMSTEDAAIVDASTQWDAGSGEPIDAGSARRDAGSSAVDAGNPTVDAGTPVVDAGATAADAGTPTVDAGAGCGNATEQEELRLTNIARAEVGASPLACDPALTQLARDYSRYMCENAFFAHTGLDGRSPFDRMHDEGITYSSAGENIAAGQSTPADVNESWLNSPGHYANIISTSYHKIGIGYWPCPSGEYHTYWTQDFTN